LVWPKPKINFSHYFIPVTKESLSCPVLLPAAWCVLPQLFGGQHLSLKKLAWKQLAQWDLPLAAIWLALAWLFLWRCMKRAKSICFKRSRKTKA